MLTSFNIYVKNPSFSYCVLRRSHFSIVCVLFERFLSNILAIKGKSFVWLSEHISLILDIVGKNIVTLFVLVPTYLCMCILFLIGAIDFFTKTFQIMLLFQNEDLYKILFAC